MDSISWTATMQENSVVGVAGTNQAAHLFGGGEEPFGQELLLYRIWNGTSWVNSTCFGNSTDRGNLGGASSNSTGAYLWWTMEIQLEQITEEFTGETSALNVKTLTQS